MTRNLPQSFFISTCLTLFLLFTLAFSIPAQSGAEGLQQPVSRDAFTVSKEPVKKMATGVDQGKYELVVDSETISDSLQSEKGLINLNIKFASGSAKLTDGAQKQLIEIAGALQNKSLINDKILITGHTDSVGSEKANLLLSQQRALAVKKGLLKLGINPSRLSSCGKGESKPLADNLSAEGRARNRRVTLSRQP